MLRCVCTLYPPLLYARGHFIFNEVLHTRMSGAKTNIERNGPFLHKETTIGALLIFRGTKLNRGKPVDICFLQVPSWTVLNSISRVARQQLLLLHRKQSYNKIVFWSRLWRSAAMNQHSQWTACQIVCSTSSANVQADSVLTNFPREIQNGHTGFQGRQIQFRLHFSLLFRLWDDRWSKRRIWVLDFKTRFKKKTFCKQVECGRIVWEEEKCDASDV